MTLFSHCSRDQTSEIKVGRIGSFWSPEGDSSTPLSWLPEVVGDLSVPGLEDASVTPTSASVFTWPSFLCLVLNSFLL